MTPFRYSLIGFVLFSALVACSTSSTTSITTQLPKTTSEMDGLESLPTTTLRPSFTPMPTRTPNLTQTATDQDNATAQSARQTAIAQYPSICEVSYGREFSPNKLWMAEFCDSESDKSPILTISNKETGELWKLVYQDYIQNTEISPFGGLAVAYWSNDGQYAYFASFTGGDGGECFVGFLDSGSGLFRLDLQTGSITTVLPPSDNFAWYGFSFSPTDRRLVYGARSRDLKILDITTGQVTKLFSVKDFSQSGDYVLSPDGLMFSYSTVLWNNMYERVAYSLRLVDAQTGSERILLESPDNCFATRSWSDNNVLTIERYDKNYDQTLVEYDLNLNKIVSEATAMP